ncbi:MAG: AAA family ATPase [Steroidobacteraceae bacterium]
MSVDTVRQHAKEIADHLRAEQEAAAAKKLKFTGRPTSAFELPPSTGAQLIKGVIARDCEVVAIRAAPGVGKSHAAIEMAASIALGKPWHGKRTKQGRVAYVAAEGAKGIRCKRLPAFRKHHGLAPTALDNIIWIDDVPNMVDREEAELLANKIGQVDATFLDTWAGCFQGSENDKESVGLALTHAKLLAKFTRGPVILIVHEGWSGDRVRGWSGQFAAFDVEISIARDDDIRTVTVSKAKDGEEGTLFSFRLRQVVLGHDAEGDAITSCVIEECAAPVSNTSGKNKGIVATLLRAAPMKEDALIAAAIPLLERGKGQKDPRKRRAREALTCLIADGLAEYVPDGSTTVRLKPDPFAI